MKIAGSAVLHAPADRVWSALNDPAVLVRTIPGCSSLEPNGPDRYRMTVTAGVASIKGVYSGEVALHDQQPPGSFRLRASGAGAPGTVQADVLVRLEDAGDGTTALSYDADAVVGGMVGGVGQRMLVGVAKKTAGEFFTAVDGVLTGAAPLAAAGAEAPVVETPVAAAPVAAPAPADAATASATAPVVGPAPAPLPAPASVGSSGGVGQRMLTGVAKKTAGEFFRAVDGVLSGPAEPGPAAPPLEAAGSVVPVEPVSPVSGPVPVGRDGFVAGAVVGAAAALLGVLVGAVVARRR